VQWNVLRKPTGLWRNWQALADIRADNWLWGVPSVKGTHSSRKRARPSVSVKRMAFISWIMGVFFHQNEDPIVAEPTGQPKARGID
jgi:hypothetical protein